MSQIVHAQPQQCHTCVVDLPVGGPIACLSKLCHILAPTLKNREGSGEPRGGRTRSHGNIFADSAVKFPYIWPLIVLGLSFRNWLSFDSV